MFSINLSSQVISKYMLLMPSFRELHQIRLSNFSITDPCDKLGHISNINHTFEFQKPDEYQEWKGLFNSPATIKPILVLCSPQNPRPTYTLSINYTNPNTLLDLRWIPSLIIKPVAICLFALVFLFMFFNIFKFQKNASRYNILVMISTFFILLYTIFSYLQLNHDYYSDKHTPFRELSITSYFVGRVLIFMAVLLGSNGWEIINTEYSKMYIFKTAVLSIILFASSALNANVYLANYAFAFLIFVILVLIILTKMIIVNINGVELEIKGHLYVIHERGIDPSTTPVFKQFVTYHRYKTVILIYIHFVFANTLISCIADEIPYWLSDLINDFADLFISFASAILFVSIKNVSSGYSNIDAQSVYLEDIQELGIENDVFQNHNLTKWEDGMELPLKPQLINKSNEHESSEGHPQNVDGEFDTSML